MVNPTVAQPHRGWISPRLFLVMCLAISLTLAQSTAISAANLLVYSATGGYRHDSIPIAIEALESRSASYNIRFEFTEDFTWFREEKLQKYDAIVFLSTTGEVLDWEGKAAFQRYLNKGGNFVGIHSASDTLRTTTSYRLEVGAYLDYHPPISNATVNVLTKDHPSTSMLPDRWEVVDEMYNFKSDPRAVGAVVVLSADESTYTDFGPRKFDQGQPHPTAWYQERGAGIHTSGVPGRSFYTSLGHSTEIWKDEFFISHVFGGITWTLSSGTTKASNPTAELGRPSSTPDESNGDPYEELDPFIIGFYTYIFRMFAIAGIFVIVGMSVLGIITIILSCFSAY